MARALPGLVIPKNGHASSIIDATPGANQHPHGYGEFAVFDRPHEALETPRTAYLVAPWLSTVGTVGIARVVRTLWQRWRESPLAGYWNFRLLIIGHRINRTWIYRRDRSTSIAGS